MTITLYTNSSAENVVNKTLTSVAVITGTLRDKCEIENPIIMLTGDASFLAQLMSSNYFYVTEFARYYYMTEKPTIIREGVYELRGRVDVLKSFATTIKANYAIIKKQTYKNNTLLNDGSFKVYQNTETVTKKFPSGFSGTTYVLMTAG